LSYDEKIGAQIRYEFHFPRFDVRILPIIWVRLENQTGRNRANINRYEMRPRWVVQFFQRFFRNTRIMVMIIVSEIRKPSAFFSLSRETMLFGYYALLLCAVCPDILCRSQYAIYTQIDGEYALSVCTYTERAYSYRSLRSHINSPRGHVLLLSLILVL